MRIRTLLIGLVVGLIAGGAVAWGAIPNSGNGQITGCYIPKIGVLRVIDNQAGATCARGETTLTWNQTGPAGAPGTPGVPGTPGTPGAPGPAGASVVKAYVTVPLPVRHDIAGTSTPGVGGALDWVALTDQTATLNTTGNDRIVLNWWTSSTCFGENRKYARALVDGTVVGGAPLTNPIGHTSDFPPVSTESSVTIQGVASVAPGTHVVTVETAIDTTASSAIGPASGGGGTLLTVQVID